MTLSPETQQRIMELAGTYPSRRTALLPALKVAQAEYGYLPPTLTAEVADLVGVPHAAAAELVAFYNMLRDEPEGSLRVVVCAQLPCALRGADRLLRDLSHALGIQPGETTADGAVTLERTSECFGACHRAPMARVNEDYVESLDPEATQRLITRLSLAPPSPLAVRAETAAESIYGPVQEHVPPTAGPPRAVDTTAGAVESSPQPEGR